MLANELSLWVEILSLNARVCGCVKWRGSSCEQQRAPRPPLFFYLTEPRTLHFQTPWPCFSIKLRRVAIAAGQERISEPVPSDCEVSSAPLKVSAFRCSKVTGPSTLSPAMGAVIPPHTDYVALWKWRPQVHPLSLFYGSSHVPDVIRTWPPF